MINAENNTKLSEASMSILPGLNVGVIIFCKFSLRNNKYKFVGYDTSEYCLGRRSLAGKIRR